MRHGQASAAQSCVPENHAKYLNHMDEFHLGAPDMRHVSRNNQGDLKDKSGASQSLTRADGRNNITEIGQ
jgi:hypothetical protein